VPVTGLADFDIGLLTEASDRAGFAPGPERLNYECIHAFVDPLSGNR
jgi:hypothetical protein